MEALLKPRIEEAMKLLTAKKGKDERWFTASLDRKMLCRRHLLSVIGLKEELIDSLILERKKMDLLQLLVHKLRFADNAYQKKPIKACLSAQEMRKHNLHFRMVHGSKSLAKEKQLLKEINGSQKQDGEEDSFDSFWNQWEEDLGFVCDNTGNYIRYHKWWWHIDRHEQIWWLQHQMPFVISKGDAKDREGEIRELLCRIESCGVVLLKKADKTPIANGITGNASPTLVKGKTWTSLGSKKALQEQIKLAGKKIEESRKTLLTLGPKRGQAQRYLVGVEKDIELLRQKLPGPLEKVKWTNHQLPKV